VNLEPFPLIRKELVIERLYLRGLNTTVIQNDSTFNFDDLIAFHTSDGDSMTGDQETSQPARFRFSNLELSGGEFTFVDLSLNKTIEMHDLDFFIPYIGWNQEDRSEAGLKFYFRNGGFLQSSIQVDPVDGHYEAQVNLDQLDLSDYFEYAENYANLGSFSGLLNTRLHLSGNISHLEEMILTGKVELIDFLLTDEQQQKFLAIKRLDCSIREGDPYNQRFVIDSIRLSQPYILFELFDSTNNFFRILNYEMEEPSDTTRMDESIDKPADSTITNSVQYSIHSFKTNNGRIDYIDHRTSESFDYHLSEIRLDTDSIDSGAEWIDLYSTMLLNNRGKLTAEVGFNPSNPFDITLNYVITDFQLSDLNIYSRHYMGFPILYGDMYYKSNTEILKGQLTSENQLVIQNVELGNKSGGIYDLPLKFALFLFKDRNGVINLDVPVRGNLNDPRVRLGKIIWNTFKNLIVKVAAAPFDLLSGLLSVDPKDIQAIEFDYLDTLFIPERKRQLDLLLELEQKKDGLGIELVYFNDIDKEKEKIAVHQVGDLFNKDTSWDYKNNPEAFQEYVMKKVLPDSMDLVSACKMLSNVSQNDSIAASLAERRISILTEYLETVSDSTRIHVTIPDPDAPKNVGSKPVFEVKYSMMDEIPDVEK
jgi:hypothetical protein